MLKSSVRQGEVKRQWKRGQFGEEARADVCPLPNPMAEPQCRVPHHLDPPYPALWGGERHLQGSVNSTGRIENSPNSTTLFNNNNKKEDPPTKIGSFDILKNNSNSKSSQQTLNS